MNASQKWLEAGMVALEMTETIDCWQTQKEVKMVLFSPAPCKWAVDIYISGKRVHCGRGFALEQTAMFEAIQWLTDENHRSESKLRT